ncbi:ATP-binding protein [Clostridium botulinum]|uniref:ATP-binding protein n=1 Tax=Clostridium botulinum TaxID=1491 RepID=UPI0007739CC5|nr:ATP-binding protein [Clostridium botulinum]NFH80190.1 ATP-binding protein [Clostridium botulinum]NFH81917.1 ATP-binding protein [Clostridium botulinum]NFI09891.1 ATP-binding protein [Clostridium botulinum]NFI14950.1 ATP-binding protein [Clostridium botulinum]NFO85032.1 ATP-binding protein [Clostridium botulinum]
MITEEITEATKNREDIINLQQYADALRSTGYKNIECAVSEIVDNSLQAEAEDVLIMIKNVIDPISGKKCVGEIAFLDNGKGMDKSLVQSCLRIGYGTRRDRKGMGRFGVGLPQSSMYACPLVEVYSWQKNSDKCYKSFLDIEKIRTGEQNCFNEPEESNIPGEYLRFVECNLFDKNFSFKESGTLVIWKKCDNVSPKTVSFLFDRLQRELGQKFRYWIHNQLNNIYLIDLQNSDNNRKVVPNDPLFLMEDNYALGNPNEPQKLEHNNPDFYDPIFESFTNENNNSGIVKLPMQYMDKPTNELKESIVTIKFSIVKSVYYDQTAFPGGGRKPGDGPIGKYAKKLEGISIVRAGREIDFGKFDFYDNLNEPVHRWWGCEISFEPELDETFGVSNNKQHVELFELDPEEYKDDEIQPVWFQLKKVIADTISAMKSRNAKVRENSNSTKEPKFKPSENVINKTEANNDIPTESTEIRKTKPVEEVKEEAKKVLEEQGISEPSEEEINNLLLNKVNIIYKANNRGPFIDYETSLGICKCIINTDHIFYEKFIKHIEIYADAKVAFELLLASLIRARDEIIDDKKKKMYDDVIDDWNYKLKKYIERLYSEED